MGINKFFSISFIWLALTVLVSPFLLLSKPNKATAVNGSCTLNWVKTADINLVATQSGNTVVLTWTSTGWGESIKVMNTIRRSEGNNNVSDTVQTLVDQKNTGSGWRDTSTSAGKTYNYQVEGRNPESGYNACSNVVSIDVTSGGNGSSSGGGQSSNSPPAVTNLNATKVEGESNEANYVFTLTWGDWQWNNMPAGAKVTFRIEQKTSDDSTSSWHDVTKSDQDNDNTNKSAKISQTTSVSHDFRIIPVATIGGVNYEAVPGESKNVQASAAAKSTTSSGDSCEKIDWGFGKWVSKGLCLIFGGLWNSFLRPVADWTIQIMKNITY